MLSALQVRELNTITMAAIRTIITMDIMVIAVDAMASAWLNG